MDDRQDVPRGPEVDFCPTPEQAQAHLEEYGFDYKPTVICTAEGEVDVPEGFVQADKEPEKKLTKEEERAQLKEEKELLKSAKRAPEKDGDPATIEYVLPNGDEGTIYVQTSRPHLYEDMTPAEFAEEVYP